MAEIESINFENRFTATVSEVCEFLKYKDIQIDTYKNMYKKTYCEFYHFKFNGVYLCLQGLFYTEDENKNRKWWFGFDYQSTRDENIKMNLEYLAIVIQEMNDFVEDLKNLTAVKLY